MLVLFPSKILINIENNLQHKKVCKTSGRLQNKSNKLKLASHILVEVSQKIQNTGMLIHSDKKIQFYQYFTPHYTNKFMKDGREELLKVIFRPKAKFFLEELEVVMKKKKKSRQTPLKPYIPSIYNLVEVHSKPLPNSSIVTAHCSRNIINTNYYHNKFLKLQREKGCPKSDLYDDFIRCKTVNQKLIGKIIPDNRGIHETKTLIQQRISAQIFEAFFSPYPIQYYYTPEQLDKKIFCKFADFEKCFKEKRELKKEMESSFIPNHYLKKKTSFNNKKEFTSETNISILKQMEYQLSYNWNQQHKWSEACLSTTEQNNMGKLIYMIERNIQKKRLEMPTNFNKPYSKKKYKKEILERRQKKFPIQQAKISISQSPHSHFIQNGRGNQKVVRIDSNLSIFPQRQTRLINHQKNNKRNRSKNKPKDIIQRKKNELYQYMHSKSSNTFKYMPYEIQKHEKKSRIYPHKVEELIIQSPQILYIRYQISSLPKSGKLVTKFLVDRFRYNCNNVKLIIPGELSQEAVKDVFKIVQTLNSLGAVCNIQREIQKPSYNTNFQAFILIGLLMGYTASSFLHKCYK